MPDTMDTHDPDVLQLHAEEENDLQPGLMEELADPEPIPDSDPAPVSSGGEWKDVPTKRSWGRVVKSTKRHVDPATEIAIEDKVMDMKIPEKREWWCCGKRKTESSEARKHARQHFLITLCTSCTDWDTNPSRTLERHTTNHTNRTGCQNYQLLTVDRRYWNRIKTKPANIQTFPLNREISASGAPGVQEEVTFTSLKQQTKEFLELIGEGAPTRKRKNKSRTEEEKWKKPNRLPLKDRLGVKQPSVKQPATATALLPAKPKVSTPVTSTPVTPTPKPPTTPTPIPAAAPSSAPLSATAVPGPTLNLPEGASLKDLAKHYYRHALPELKRLLQEAARRYQDLYFCVQMVERQMEAANRPGGDEADLPAEYLALLMQLPFP